MTIYISGIVIQDDDRAPAELNSEALIDAFVDLCEAKGWLFTGYADDAP